MAVPKKFLVVPNTATRDLWRIAESGAIDELDAVLPRAEINARNEHGMTALMRAARHGRLQMVRALLEHGADPNLERNDNFTALSLAAFFGHTEIVELLLKHGARTDVATRYGTSPQMWATARSNGDVAKCLEKRGANKGAKKVPSPPAPVQSISSHPVSPTPLPTPAPAIEVRTLKEPPEIWDLVHEAPRNFNAGSAFMARIGSTTNLFVLLAAAVVVVAGLGVAGAWSWQGAWWPRLSKTDKPTQAAVSSSAVAPVKPAAAAPAVEPPASSINVETPITAVETPVNVPRRSRSFARSRSVEANLPSVNKVDTALAPAAPTVAVKSDPLPNENATKNKPAAPMSSQMISPPKPAQPKAKVIQWP